MFWSALSCPCANALNEDIFIYTFLRLFFRLIHCIVNAYFFLTNSAWVLLTFFFSFFFLLFYQSFPLFVIILAHFIMQIYYSRKEITLRVEFLYYHRGHIFPMVVVGQLITMHLIKCVLFTTHIISLIFNFETTGVQPCCSCNSYNSQWSWKLRTCSLPFFKVRDLWYDWQWECKEN